ncbi:MAG: hypothetical protein E3J86_07670 [Candidatus Thorarchaeota archaeon]|nr:MAG: hypothetical protein E3J86_07670 [Candidatus Thorarchaeota archaeon]
MQAPEKINDLQTGEDEAQAILRFGLIILGLAIIGLFYWFAIPLRWFSSVNLIQAYTSVIVLVGAMLLSLRLIVHLISPDSALTLTMAITEAAGLVILLFPVTPTRGYIEMGQPFGIVFGFHTSSWPLFIAVGASVLLVSWLARRSVEREPSFFMMLIGVFGIITIGLCWLLVPILREITPSHIAGLVMSIQILIMQFSWKEKQEIDV